MDLTLKVWRQEGPNKPGEFKEYEAKGISPDSSFLEMLDVVNERLIHAGDIPIAFDHDCREGICGMCGVMINGHPHGDQQGTATCQLHMRKFSDGDRIVIEPWRARGMPIVKDLVVDRSALDRIIEAGGYISVNTGGAPDANLIPVPKDSGRRGHGCGGVHRMCGMHRCVSQQCGTVVHGGEALSPQSAATRSTGALSANGGHGGEDGGVLWVVHQPC